MKTDYTNFETFLKSSNCHQKDDFSNFTEFCGIGFDENSDEYSIRAGFEIQQKISKKTDRVKKLYLADFEQDFKNAIQNWQEIQSIT